MTRTDWRLKAFTFMADAHQDGLCRPLRLERSEDLPPRRRRAVWPPIQLERPRSLAGRLARWASGPEC